ncbi:MAG TPA: deoxyribodipyrimidine photolyase [Polyangium sp.]|nr:deoxyribodipyrimidine photolyase [Polyangium sp.]
MRNSKVPHLRVNTANDGLVRSDGSFVLYWMTSARRTSYNFGLQRAVEWSRVLGLPLVVLEALRVGYKYASDRFHAFVLQGMASNQQSLSGRGVVYHPYVERAPGEGKGLVMSLANHAAVVITDDYPSFFLPKMIASAARQISVRFELVDSNGLVPMRATQQVFTTAFSFRAWLQKNIATHLKNRPSADPLQDGVLPAKLGLLPPEILSKWPAAPPDLLTGASSALAPLPIDHGVGVVSGMPGGEREGRNVLARFLRDKLSRYDSDRNDPDAHATSGLSPYLHFGHVGAHEVFDVIARAEGFSDANLQARGGKREGFWGLRPPVEAFLEQLITWREVGFNLCFHLPHDYMRYESLPLWAQRTLDEHAADRRAKLYTRQEMEQARTGDAVWNAAQRELVRDGRIHNYLRMLWGKRVLEWTLTPREALDVLIELNDKYALDGRDPNSYSGIFWILGRYDRPWAPVRPVYGSIRYMSSTNTLKKIDMKKYLVKYGR